MSAPVKSTELKKYKLKFACWTLFTAIGTVGDDQVVKYVTIPQIWKLFQVKFFLQKQKRGRKRM